jgi:hypothetical protein
MTPANAGAAEAGFQIACHGIHLRNWVADFALQLRDNGGEFFIVDAPDVPMCVGMREHGLSSSGLADTRFCRTSGLDWRQS